jgi:hypothetical protein
MSTLSLYIIACYGDNSTQLEFLKPVEVMAGCQHVPVGLLMSTGVQRLDVVFGVSKWKLTEFISKDNMLRHENDLQQSFQGSTCTEHARKKHN